MNIAIVVSRFNNDITDRLLEDCKSRLLELEIPEKNIEIVKVPGAIELPITAQQFAMTNRFQAIICLGAVILGETHHYYYVCQQVNKGCQIVALKHNIPLIFGVLTTQNKELAMARVDGRHSRLGREYADNAVEMIRTLAAIKNSGIKADKSIL